jgi:hypothetical protein
VLYGSLRVGPWSIRRRDRLARLRDIAAQTTNDERALDFSVRFAQRRKAATDPTVELPRDDHHDDQS